MSGSTEEEKNEAGKMVPLDLARNQISAVKTVDGKTPIVIPGQHLRGMRLLTQAVSSTTPSTPTIITTNILPPAVIKQGNPHHTKQQFFLHHPAPTDTSGTRTQIANIIGTTQAQVSGNITIQRPAQITLTTTMPVVAQNVPSGTTYHVPRGPAVVANLAAPRSNVASAIRAPMVVTAQTSGQVKEF